MDVAVKYLSFFLDDDQELERIKEVSMFSTQSSTRLYLILTDYACMNNSTEVLIIAYTRSLFAKSKVQCASVRYMGLMWSLFFIAHIYMGGIWQDL